MLAKGRALGGVMPRTSADVRREAGHPVIDADGHMLEVLDATHPYLRESLGPALFQRWLDRGPLASVSQRPRTAEERRRTRTPQGSWWGGPPSSNTLDRATATLPPRPVTRSWSRSSGSASGSKSPRVAAGSRRDRVTGLA